MVTVDEIRKVAMALPRTSEHLIRDRIKFRVGQIVYVALSQDETSMGFGYPKEERAALIAAQPDKFFMPIPSDERFHWVRVWLAAIDATEMRELVEDAWRMVVPKSVAAQHLGVPAPTMSTLREAGLAFSRLGDVDRTWWQLREATAPGLDLTLAEHRATALSWLNSWGCRLPYRGSFEPNVAAWAQRADLPDPVLATATAADIDALAGAYAELAALPIGRRSLGPTAAAKLLYALRPRAVMPWDAAIATHLHGARGEPAFAAHLRLGRRWAEALLRDSGLTEKRLAEEVGRPGISLAKILDEYTYMLITRWQKGGG